MQIRLTVNGREVAAEVVPTATLASFLRTGLGLTGTKLGCEVGECSACTVLLDGRPVTSCLVPLAQADGRSVLTVESLISAGELHALQATFVAENAIQCGYCIPGMLMTARALLDRHPDATAAAVRRLLSGNLCRCTGYQKIVDAVLAAAREVSRHG